MVDQLYQPPGPFSPSRSFRYARNSQPVFAWTRPRGWGPLTYSLSLDGKTAVRTTATAAAPPAPIADGRHSWQVFATNPVGQQSRSGTMPVFIDTIAPRVKVKLRGQRRAGRVLRADVAYADRPPAGEPRRNASGVARVIIKWGDRTTVRLRPGSRAGEHVYRRRGRYRITVLVFDRAGNLTRVVLRVKVAR
jgi:hypothetical protein